MRVHEIIGTISDNFLLGLTGVIGLGLIFTIGYFFIYRKLIGGKKKPSIKDILLGSALTGYIIMVIGVTFLGRGANFEGSINLHFLSSYREAWNSFGLVAWQQLILNILMFLPLGILLPLVHKRFHKIKYTMGTALGFTILIETVQLITGFGVFELDDIFNNILGALIGYGIIKAILSTLKSRKYKLTMTFVYLSPLILVIAVFAGIFTHYNSKEFGNISVAYGYKINMKNVRVSLNTELNNDKLDTSIYKSQGYNRDTGKEFALSFFENLGIDTKDLDTDQYNDNAIYWVRGNPSYNIWLDYLNGSYSYKDFSAFEDEVEVISSDEDRLLEELENFNIDIPTNAVLNTMDRDGYEWTIEREIVGDTLREGSVYCLYYSDGTIKEINNKFATYNKVRNVSIKNEEEAYEELIAGKFSYFNFGNDIKSIDINGVELDYYLDSKGYYQPVYSFDSSIGGNKFKIIIPALL